jgi:hypothetical protein
MTGKELVMHAFRSALMMLIVASLAPSAFSAPREAPEVYCNGWICGGTGLPMYNYPVESVGQPVMDFRVGSNDLNPAHYANVLIPEGWNFAVEEVWMNHLCASCDDHTPHGADSPGPCWCVTQGSVHWWTDDPDKAVELFTFGYDHIWPAEDVSWQLTTAGDRLAPRGVFMPSWDEPVGMGNGPVHGPCLPPHACADNDECDPDHFCFKLGCDDDEGWCLQRATVCPNVWNPVCGCDGVTYGNSCYAAMAGVNIDHPGPCPGDCPEDLNGDGLVNTADLLILLGNWGQAGIGDIDGSGTVNAADLLILLAAWGECPE